ncbi:hypothetical protein [Sphaerisporangium corydalis]|uniref:Uncharacterized protein n=1 Tax=Sphaerisporangium corydalis TaxID=1441875 RepID=A0ABV9ERJ7_9ACTN|nr:hypothetical protein [Sphaerisporangium corydalis]
MSGKRRRHTRRWANRERREWLRLGAEVTLVAWRTALAVWTALHGV